MQIGMVRIEGDLVVDGDYMLNGKVTGDATVKRGARFYLNGLVAGRLVVESGRVELRGKVAGDVVNRGGELDVWGLVGGSLTTESGQTRLDTEAVVRGEVVGPAARVELPKDRVG